MSKTKTKTNTNTLSQTLPLLVAPAQVLRGEECLINSQQAIASFGQRPLIIGGPNSLQAIKSRLEDLEQKQKLITQQVKYSPDCSENSLANLHQQVKSHQADFIIGIGGGKALDTAKLVAYQCQLPIVTIPTSAATCAAWTALSNVYSDEGAFQYDVGLNRCPDLVILDYSIVVEAPKQTLVAGIGDAIAKWYEASVSSGNSQDSLTIAAVQQARVLRDILLQKSSAALKNPGGAEWKSVVDATVLLAGVIGGLGGANCRTVAAHAVHNALTHLPQTHHKLHGEKVAYGILVQLRLEEMVHNNQLATTSRKQLSKFYQEIGLPCSLEDLGLKTITLDKLRLCAEIASQKSSDIHRLPFKVTPEQLLAAMVSQIPSN